ncbi:MAG: YciI family protein [Muribaculaceae bacterium]|nr:YciI family protein [Muribaculaceae bacterium]
MFIFKLTYKKPLAEVERFLAAHREFLDRFYQAGKLVVSGPREPRVGGVILCNAATEAEAREIIAQDPFFVEEIADYEVTQFHATKHCVDNFLNGLE